jgi:hypothetical protein
MGAPALACRPVPPAVREVLEGYGEGIWWYWEVIIHIHQYLLEGDVIKKNISWPQCFLHLEAQGGSIWSAGGCLILCFKDFVRCT